MSQRKTPSGRKIYCQFKDYCGDPVTLDSSTTLPHIVWLACKTKGDRCPIGANLTPAQARRLIAGLQRFIKDAEGKRHG